jgi:AraC-like DNA-binding protein
MDGGLSYREYLPPRDLARWIACFWEIRGTVAQSSGFAHRVLPDGCADLIFNLHDPGAAGGGGGVIVGPMSTGQVIDLRAAVNLLGVRLRPGALRGFVGIAADRLLDQALPSDAAPPVLRLDPAELAELPDSMARVGRLTAVCRARLAALDEFDPVVATALARWARLPCEVGFPRVAVLVRDIGLSERAFERRFAAHVGLTPVRFRRLARLRAVLRLHSNGARDWAALAATAGFSDQSHLVRDFHAWVGLSPTQWAATQMRNAGFLQDGQITSL